MPLKPDFRQLALGVTIYGTYTAFAVVTDMPGHWEGRIPPEGLAWTIAPGLRRCVGPIPFNTFVHELCGDGEGNPSGALGDLYRAIDAAPKFPPFHLPGGEPANEPQGSTVPGDADEEPHPQR
jgi:hypothetical protein